VWAFDLLLRHRHGFQTYFVSAQQRKKTCKSAVFMGFSVDFHFTWKWLYLPGREFWAMVSSV
jgi:uncharacterized protein (UPF0128 family)